MLHAFFSSYVLKNERKEYKTPNTSNLMLEAKVVNFKESPMSSSMQVSKDGFKCISSLDLKLMVITKFKAFNNNQCPTNWSKMQAKIIRLKQSTILTNEPCNRRTNTTKHSNISLPAITHGNSSM
jgi:hypothetical protein